MKYRTQSIIIGRMKRPSKEDDFYPCFIAMFDINDPHITGEVPKNQLEFSKISKVVIEGCNINYLPAGNDLVVNDLEYVEIMEKSPQIIIKGKHKSK